VVEVLLDSGEDVNFLGGWWFDVEGEDYTALSVAVERGHWEVAELLLNRGADPNRNWVLVSQAHRGDIRSVEWLLAAGANKYLSEALRNAAFKGHRNIVKVLLEHGADPNATDLRFQESGGAGTPLMTAAEEGHEEVLKLLLEHGADPTASNVEGRTAMDFAADDSIKEMLAQAMSA